MSDRLAVFNAGRIEQIGTPADVYEHPTSTFVASFVGTSNLLTGDAARAVIGSDGIFTVRPEKIWFATSGLAGKVRTRIFQGNHWLYQIETAGGVVTVIRQNTGEAMPAEGDGVHLAWAAV